LSGTPLDRTDKRSIEAISWLGPVVCRVLPQTLIDAGVLSTPKITMVPVQQQLPPSSNRKYSSLYKHLIVRSDRRNAAVLEMTKRAEKPCMVFVKHLPHAMALTRMAQSYGINAIMVDGRDRTVVREQRLASLTRGAIDVIVCTKVFQEGIDVPELRSVVVATGGKSTIDTIQRIGRGSRVAAGKDTFEVWDVLDTGEPILQRHARERIKAYQREGYEVHVEHQSKTPLPGGATKQGR